MITKGDYSSAQHAKILQLESVIQSFIDCFDNSDESIKTTIGNNGYMLYNILEMKKVLKNKNYNNDYRNWLESFKQSGFVD